MAVENDAANYFHTESLVSKRGRRHYRVPVRSQHWQLRSLISAEQRHLVYFPGGTQTKQIQRLNTVTHECETIKMLNFAPRCLVANNGWLCCGSETGEFVAVQLDEGVDSDAVGGPMSLDPDALMDLGSNASREDSLLSLLAQSRRTSKNMSAKSLKITTDRINCITLWFPDLLVPAGVGAYKDPAAILADNKGNVSLVSLVDFEKKEQAEPLDVVKYPDYVNRAVVSPDGRMLIAILDDPYLYVHMREEKPADASSPTQTPQYEWKQRQRIFLTSQRKEDASDSRGSFAACFNSSGTILAVGTQHGTVSVFDAAALEDPDKDALMTTFKSSRPESGPGAIRDMSFCPGPFDILAWTEDRGHVGVADMRMKFASRQILDIGVDADFDHVNIFDRNTIDPRLLDAQAARRAGTLASPRRAGDGADSLNPPLSASETVVLEALQGDRQRRDRLNQRPDGTERSVPDLSWTYLSSLRPHTGEGEGSNRAGRRSASVTRVARGSSTSRAQRSALDEYLDQRERARNRAQGNASERLSAIRRSDPRWIDRLGETVAAMRDSQDRTDNSYLNVLDILQARERTTDNENEDSSLLVPLVNQVVNRWEESAVRGTLPTANAMALDHGVFEVPPSRDNTAGLAWSDDGRIMYVGAQDGIYEFHINTQSRKFHPGYSLC